jgi:four helix bundle protein
MPHEKIEAWRLAHRLALELYDASDRWPKSDRYELTSQLRRAAVSAPANIAEGFGRYGPRELRRHLNIALGSLAELSYLLRFARERELLSQTEWESLDEQRDRAGKATWGLLRSIIATEASKSL